MTAQMIEWTLEVLEWIRPQLWESWPEAEMRGSYPELEPEGYKIRFRDQGRQFWLILSSDVIRKSAVSEVKSALEAGNWIEVLRQNGSLSVGLLKKRGGQPSLLAVRTIELNPNHS
jgi:hypothetical protein